MPKRQTQEEIVVDFFQNGDLVKVETVSNIVKGIIKRRFDNKKPSKKSTTKPAPPASPAT